MRRPGLVVASGENDNDLLAFAVARRDERATALLLDHGASPIHANVHGWTALHQAAYVGEPPLAERLLDAGASTHLEARGEGGTALVVALFWGHARRPSCWPRAAASRRPTCASPRASATRRCSAG